MKKSFLSLAIIASTAIAVNAQSIAPEIGMNYSKLVDSEGNDKTGSRVGLRVGANVNIPVANNLYLAPGLFYTSKGGQNTSAKVLNSYSVTDISMNYLEVPLNLVYRLPLSVGALNFSGGGYLGYGLNGKVKSTPYLNDNAQPESSSNISWGDGTTQYNRVDYGLNAGVAYELPMGLYVRGQYQHGLANLSNRSNITTNNAGFILSVGYNLNRWNR